MSNQKLFDLLHNEFGVIATETDMYEIILAVESEIINDLIVEIEKIKL